MQVEIVGCGTLPLSQLARGQHDRWKETPARGLHRFELFRVTATCQFSNALPKNEHAAERADEGGFATWREGGALYARRNHTESCSGLLCLLVGLCGTKACSWQSVEVAEFVSMRLVATLHE